jgi:hypothetical protein
MTVSDIIRRDQDRVFIVDPECFVIFTGDSINDKRPFIRIGNWMGLPIEIIPLVENIIVTDSLAGTPSHEQFNIDIKYLSTNRYIGSKHIVKKYLEYQQLFGLDLHNASVVDADRDIPEISKTSAVSNNDDFIGIFYRGGNFKVTHQGNDLFDLKEHHDLPSSDKGAHDRIATLAKPRRYAGSGFAIVEHNPVFYHGNNFISYLFPNSYFGSFFSLGINPRQINTIVHPSENYLGISRFLKWRHSSGGKVVINTDHTDAAALLSNLFTGVKIQIHPFTGMKSQPAPGLTISQVSESYNLICEFEQTGSGKSLRTAFVKGSLGLKKMTREKVDLLIMNYSVYEDSSYLARAFKAPIAIIDDGNPVVSKLPSMDNPIIRNDMQYEIFNLDLIELRSRMSDYIDEEIINRIDQQDYTFIESTISEGITTEVTADQSVAYFNFLSYMRLLYNTTHDRKLSSIIKRPLHEGYASVSRKKFYTLGSQYRIDLILSDGILYEFASILQDPSPSDILLLESGHQDGFSADTLTDQKDRDLYKRMVEDRSRLKALLHLFMQNPSYRSSISDLRKAIDERKRLFANEQALSPEKSAGFIDRLRGSLNNGESCSGASSSPLSQFKRSVSCMTRSIYGKIALTILLAAIIAGMTTIAYRTHKRNELSRIEQEKKIQTILVQKEQDRVKIKYSVSVDEYDIYLFANEVAVKNGYAPIPVTDVNRKNPNWIYPGNIFIMPDGERVTIMEGDSLWKLAHTRVEKKHIAFFTEYDKIRNDYDSGKTIDKAVIENLESLASNPKQRNLVSELRKVHQ